LLAITSLALLCAAPALAGPGSRVGTAVPDFVLLDQKGRAHELARLPGKAVVIFVTGNGCPIARQTVPALKELRKEYFERGVTFWMLDANLQDDRASIAKEGDELDVDRVPILHDEAQVVARQLGATHTAEAIAVSLPDRRIFYRGPVDDRLAVGGQRAAAQHQYLRDAIEEHLAGRRVSEPVVTASGCAVGYEPERAVSYANQIAPVLVRRCGGCHGAGGEARPRLTGHASAAAAAPALRRALLERAMPPASPDLAAGLPLAGEGALTGEEARRLARWLDTGAPRDDGDDALARHPGAPGGWPLGTPSIEVAAREVAARETARGRSSGARRLTDFRSAAGAWLAAVDARPDDAAATGSISVWAVTGEGATATRALLAEWAPGHEAAPFPEGAAARLEPGARLEVEVRDRAGAVASGGARVALYFATGAPRRRYELRAAHADAITLPADEGEAGKAFGVYRFGREALVHELRPRMDRRGAWFKYEALYPNGKRETLLSIPAWAGPWRRAYRLAAPKRVPAGTLLYATGGYDNSRRNPSNPAPARRLTCAGAACDELFLGVVGVSEDVGATAAAAP
jgi:peroxiredoxin